MKKIILLLTCLATLGGLSGCVIIGQSPGMGCSKCCAHFEGDAKKPEMCKKCGHKADEHTAGEKGAGEAKEHQH